MSIKTTKKAVNNNYIYVIAVGYAELQTLLSYETPVAHTERREGWGADIYYFGATAIVTGYIPFGNVKANYEVCKDYEKQALAIQRDTTIKDKKTRMYNLLVKFIKEVTNN